MCILRCIKCKPGEQPLVCIRDSVLLVNRLSFMLRGDELERVHHCAACRFTQCRPPWTGLFQCPWHGSRFSAPGRAETRHASFYDCVHHRPMVQQRVTVHRRPLLADAPGQRPPFCTRAERKRTCPTRIRHLAWRTSFLAAALLQHEPRLAAGGTPTWQAAKTTAATTTSALSLIQRMQSDIHQLHSSAVQDADDEIIEKRGKQSEASGASGASNWRLTGYPMA